MLVLPHLRFGKGLILIAVVVGTTWFAIYGPAKDRTTWAPIIARLNLTVDK